MNEKSCILILSYNHPELTARSVRSARNAASLPLYLLHNGSLPRHVERLKTEFPDIHHLILEQNRSYSGGINWGLRALFQRPYDWVFVLTNDCVLEKLNLPSGPPALVAPLVYRRKKPHVDSVGAAFDPSRARLWHCKTPDEFHRLTQERGGIKTPILPYVPGSAFWLHREIFANTGPFDESLGIYWDDVDFSARVFLRSAPILTDLRTEVLHAVSKTTSKDPHYTTFLFQRNKSLVSKRYVTGIRSRLRLKAHLLGSLVATAARLLRQRQFGRLKLVVRAHREARRISAGPRPG